MTNPSSKDLYDKCLVALREGRGVTYSDAHYLRLDVPEFGQLRLDNYVDCYNRAVPVGMITEREHRESFLKDGRACLAISGESDSQRQSYLILHPRDLVEGYMKGAVLNAAKNAGFEVSDDEVVIVGGDPYTYVPDPSVVPELRALYEQLA